MTGQLLLFDDSHPDPRSPEMKEQVLEPIVLDKDRTNSLEPLTPPQATFRMTYNYSYTGGLIGRLLRALKEKSESGNIGNRDDIASELTIPSERLKGIFNFVRRTELTTAKNELTPLGELVLQRDPFILNPGLLWLLHYLLSSNANIVIWSRLFNQISYEMDEIAPPDIVSYYTDIQGGMKDPVFRQNAGKEIGTTLRSYSDDLFKPIGLVIRIDDNHYGILTDHFAIPPYTWLACLMAYRDRYYPGAATLEIPLLINAHFSPGRLFRQNEQWVRAALDNLHGRGLLAVETRLGLDQVRFKSGITWLSAVARHFQEGR